MPSVCAFFRLSMHLFVIFLHKPHSFIKNINKISYAGNVHGNEDMSVQNFGLI